MQKYSKKIAISKFFQIFSLIVIFLNCVTYTLLQNQKGNYRNYVNSIKNLEFAFFVFYLLEMTLKMLGFGFFLSSNAYFRVGWNLLDFLVIMGLILSYSQILPTFNFSILRSLRLLGPLRTIASFSRLKIILRALFSALPLFFDALVILLFSYTIYAIIGLQLFSGVLKYRCTYPETGLLYSDELCGNLSCPSETVCVKGLTSVNMDVINFDNIFSCLLQVIFIVTLDSWSLIMYSVQKAFSNYAWIYFVSLVITGAYMMNNLLLAVIKVKFSESQSQLMSESKVKKHKHETEIKFYDFGIIKREGYWLKNRKPLTIKNPQSPKKHPEENLPALPLLNLNLVLNSADKIDETPVSKFSSFKKHTSKIKSKLSKTSILGLGGFGRQRHSSFMTPRVMPRMPRPKPIAKDSVFSIISPSHKLSSDGFASFLEGSVAFSDENQQKRERFQVKMMKAFKELANMQLKSRVLNFFNYGKMKKKRRQSKMFANLKPEYLKLYIDMEKTYISLSENDVIIRDKLQNQISKMEKELDDIKKQKIPFRYILKKNSGLLDVLQKIYSKQIDPSFDVDFGKTNDSSEFMKFLKRQSIRKSKNKQILKPLTMHMMTRKRSTLKAKEENNNLNKKNKNNSININLKIKIKNKKEKILSLKSIKKSIDNISLKRKRAKTSMGQQDHVLKMIKNKNKQSYCEIQELIKTPILNSNEKAPDENDLDNTENHDQEFDMPKEYMRIRVLKICLRKYSK